MGVLQTQADGLATDWCTWDNSLISEVAIDSKGGRGGQTGGAGSQVLPPWGPRARSLQCSPGSRPAKGKIWRGADSALCCPFPPSMAQSFMTRGVTLEAAPTNPLLHPI